MTTYAGPAGDHNDRAMAQVGVVGQALAQRLGVTGLVVGSPVLADPQNWEVELARCAGSLREMAERIDEVMTNGAVPVSAITRCAVALVAGGKGLPQRLTAAIAERPVNLHLDCDVLQPGLVRTDYTAPRGLTLEDLHACADAGSFSEVLGLEIAEFEGEGSATIDDLIDALEPVLP